MSLVLPSSAREETRRPPTFMRTHTRKRYRLGPGGSLIPVTD
ncbi:MAG: hypothetical protein ABSB59_27850 [Streptosporangiaceae bacterium]